MEEASLEGGRRTPRCSRQIARGRYAEFETVCSRGLRLNVKPLSRQHQGSNDMSQTEGEVADRTTTEKLRAVLKSQYHASLAMLRQALERCPEDLWDNKDQGNAVWQTA